VNESPSAWIFDVAAAEFDRQVLQRSHETPVVVDFWAPWCGPCRMLGPILEKLANEKAGSFVLAKINIDDAPDLASRYGIQAIPAVKAFRSGQPILEFEGVLPERQLRDFLERVIPTAGDQLARQAAALEAANPAEAERLYRQVLAQDRAYEAALVGLARLLITRGDDEEAGKLLEQTGPGAELGAEVERLTGILALRQISKHLGDELAARRRLDQEPRNAQALYELGCILAGNGQYPEALKLLLSAAELDRTLAAAKVREVMVLIFHVIGVRWPMTTVTSSAGCFIELIVLFSQEISMLLFDAHLDLAWNALDWNRDLQLSIDAIRAAENGMTGKARGRNTVSFPEMRRGQVGLCIATLLARLLRDTMPPIQRFRSMTAAYAAAHGQLAYYRSLTASGYLRWITDSAGLETHVGAWLAGNPSQAAIGFILSMEGADPVLAPEQIGEWWDAGLRIIGPAHYGPSPYAHGTGTEGGLFPPGPALLKEMERVGMILDVTHLSDESFDEALAIYGGPVLASHHNCRALVPGQRQLTDDQIRRLIGRGAVIGSALDAWMLYPGWIRGETQPDVVGLEAMIDHMDRVCQLAGNSRHAAIGSDLDGGFGTEQTPRDLNTIADLQNIPELLRQRGYAPADIENICYGNWVHFFREAWAD
jgi:membrane dipeptidase